MAKPTKRNYHAVVFTTWQAHALMEAAAAGAEKLREEGAWAGPAGTAHWRACGNGIKEIGHALEKDGVVLEESEAPPEN